MTGAAAPSTTESSQKGGTIFSLEKGKKGVGTSETTRGDGFLHFLRGRG